MRRLLRVAAFAFLAAGGTVAVGWWIIPLLAAIWVRALPSDRRPVRTTAVGTALGWIGLLGLGALTGPIAAVAWCVSAALGLPRWGFPIATLLFGVLLAASAAFLVRPAPIR